MNILRKFKALPSLAKLVLAVTLFAFFWLLWPADDNRQSLRPPKRAEIAPPSCITLRPETVVRQNATISERGQYCLASDFWQRRFHGAGHSWPGRSHHLITIGVSNITMDLQNHILHSDGHSSGIVVNLDMKKREEVGVITIKNGVIDLRGMGTAIVSHYKWRMDSIDEIAPDSFVNYKGPKLILENLLIKTEDQGLALMGEGIIIRNCVIESGGVSAIIMAGPNGQIINNTIVLTNPFMPGSMRGVNFSEFRHFIEFFKAKNVPMAAITLHQATGTLIRGNVIEVKGKSSTRHNIYLANDSKNVRIEGNTIVGSDDPVTQVNGSTMMMTNNVFIKKNAWWEF